MHSAAAAHSLQCEHYYKSNCGDGTRSWNASAAMHCCTPYKFESVLKLQLSLGWLKSCIVGLATQISVTGGNQDLQYCMPDKS